MKIELFRQKTESIISLYDKETIALYSRDESRYPAGSVEMVLFPQTEKDVATIMKASVETETPVTTVAARTGISGASVPQSGVLLSLEKILFPLSVRLDNKQLFITAPPAISLHEIERTLSTPSLCSHGEKEALRLLHAENRGWSYPVDPTEMTASLGGSVATNASGARSFRYGATREWIRSVRVILPDGESITLIRGQNRAQKHLLHLTSDSGKKYRLPLPRYAMPQTKNAAGLYAQKDMDAVDLFIGSEGILGTIVSIDILIIPKHNSISALLALPDSRMVLPLVEKLKKEFSELEFLEFADGNTLDLIRKNGSDDGRINQLGKAFKEARSALFFDIKSGLITEEKTHEILNKISKLLNQHTISTENCFIAWEAEDKETIRYLRHLAPERINEAVATHKRSFPELHKVGTDFAVPDADFLELYTYSRALLTEAKMPFVVFEHIGQSHLHFNMLPQNPEQMKTAKECYFRMAQKSVALGGTISAEHGVGKIKREYLEILYKKEGIEMMRQLKKVVDPLFLLNRGTMFTEQL